MNKKTYFFLVALIMVFVFCGSSAVTAADPTNNTINGTITIKEYDSVKNLTNATVTVNNSGKVLGTATTDQNGYYSINFFSNQTKFNVTANFVGCNLTNQTVTIAKGVGSDPNYYGTANIQLTPNTIWWTGTMGPSTKVYIQHYGGYYSAGQLQVTMDRVNFYYAYCIDIYTGIGPNDLLLVNGPLPGTRGDLNRSIDWAKVNYILNHYDPSKNTTDNARNIEGAAIQCAIWYFTSANYGLFPVNNASYKGYYQFMTYDNRYNSSLPSPYDARTETQYSGSYNRVENRAWNIINSAIAMKYPATIELSPNSSNLENGGTLNLTAVVKDQNGNPLNNITVNFTSNSGTFNATSAVTNALGIVKVSISGLTNNITSLVTASVTGSYGNLLYDNPLNPKQNLVAANLLPFTLSGTSYINCNPKANVTLSQTVNSPVNVGDTVTYIVTANNRGPNAATNIIISDLIPASLANVVATPSVGTYNSITGLWIIPTLNNGASATLTITGKATVAMAGLNTTNNATRIAQDQYNVESNTTSAQVYTKKANVTVTNTATNSTLNVGNNGVFTVVVTNNGPDTVTNIKLTDLIPGFTGTVTIGSYNNTTGIWTIPSLANGTSATLTLSGMITAAMAGTNITSHVTENQTEYPFNTTAPDAKTYIKKANVVLSQFVNSPVNVGGLVTYVVTALNNGPDNATNIVISDVLPAALSGFTVTPSVGTYNSGVWTIPSLVNGASVTLSIVGNATAVMAGFNTTNIATQTGQTEFSDLYTSANATAYTKMADTKLSQTVTTPVNVGGTVTYVVTITNTGPDTATNFIIQDNVPVGLANYTVTPSTGTYINGNWTIFSLANGESATLTITGTATAAMAGKNTTNTATKITETEYDPTTIGESTEADAYTKEANVTVTNTATNSTLNVGSNGVFTVVVTNNGPDNATNIKLTDLIPGFTGTVTMGSYDNTTGIWTIPSLANGSSATLTLSGMITASMAGTNITSHVTENQTEYPFNVTVGDAWTHVNKANVVLSQFVGSPVNVGNLVSFIVTALNNGPDNATNVNIGDVVPGALSGVVVIPSVGTYNSATGIWTIPSLLNGGSATLNITGMVTSVMAGLTTNNTATQVNQTEYDPTVNTTTAGTYALAVDIVVKNYPWYYDPVNGYLDTYYVGNTPVMIADVSNNGPDDATGVVVEYVIGKNFQYIDLNTQGIGVATYNNETRTITWNIGNMPRGGFVFMKVFLYTIGSGNKTVAMTNIARLVSVDQIDTNSTNNESSYGLIAPLSADIQVNQNYTTYTVNGTEYVNYTIRVVSNGPDNATGIKIKDLLPAGLEYAGNALSTDGGVTWITNSTAYTKSNGVWNIGNITLGSSPLILNITAKITGTGTIKNRAYLSAKGQPDWNYDNNEQTTILNLTGEYNKTVDINVRNYPWYYDLSNQTYLDTYYVGNTPVMIADVSNNGPDDATGVVVEYVIGKNFQYIDLNTQGIGVATYNNETRTITWNIGNMPRGGFVFMKVFLYTIGSGNKTVAMTNIARLVSVDQNDTNSTNNESSYGLIAPLSADIQVNQNYTTYTVNGTEYVNYTIRVVSNGPDNATGVKITDLLPAGLEYAGNALSTDGGVTWITNSTAYTKSNGVWNIGNITLGSSPLILNITAKITGTGTFRNRAYLSAKTAKDWNYDNNEQTTIIARPS